MDAFLPFDNPFEAYTRRRKDNRGDQRMTCDFSLSKNMPFLPPIHRYKDVNLGGGALLDMGIYLLM